MLDCPQLRPGTSHWQFKIDHDRNVYTTENGKSYKLSFFFFVGWFVSQRAAYSIFTSTPLWQTQRKGVDMVAHGSLMVISLHLRELQRALEREPRDLSSRLGFVAEGYRFELFVFICIQWPLRCYHTHN